jgi:pilus assembly protein Flp/PilA
MLFLPREEGQGLVEYALILVLVAIVVIVILAILGPAVGNVFSNVVNAI